MKKGDIKYSVDIDIKYPSIYEVEIIEPHKEWENNWLVKYKKVVFDFLNMPGYSLEGQDGIFAENIHLFDTVEEAINSLISSKYGMKPRVIVKRLFK